MRNIFALEYSPDVYVVETGEDGGRFVMSSIDDSRPLKIIASIGGKWDHVSVSRSDRCPSWAEMEQVKRQFFKSDETAMQLHVPPSDHISHHPYCLHLWRPQDKQIWLPPKEFVA